MKYLSGVVRSEILGLRSDLGILLTPRMNNRPDLTQTAWAADTGCFRQPQSFSLSNYLAFLRDRLCFVDTCLFATAPDIVGNATATWERSQPVLPLLREAGFRAAYVAQDGIEREIIRWDAFDCLFLGGSTTWKLSHYTKSLTAEAVRRGKTVHMGRVNSLMRLRTAAMWGCTSADGTFLAFAPDVNMPRMLRWLDAMRDEPLLNFGV